LCINDLVEILYLLRLYSPSTSPLLTFYFASTLPLHCLYLSSILSKW